MCEVVLSVIMYHTQCIIELRNERKRLRLDIRTENSMTSPVEGNLLRYSFRYEREKGERVVVVC